MPWNPKTFDAVCAGLRRSARDGNFVPCVWNGGITTNSDGGCRYYGCGWGIVGWFAAVFEGGAGWAKRMLPLGCRQGDVNAVLMHVGLTADEIARMTPMSVWERFDRELITAYNNRHHDWQTYIQTSMVLAEYFIAVLRRVEVSDDVEMRFLPIAPASPIEQLKLPIFDTLVLSAEDTAIGDAGVTEPSIPEAA